MTARRLSGAPIFYEIPDGAPIISDDASLPGQTCTKSNLIVAHEISYEAQYMDCGRRSTIFTAPQRTEI
jgi:hypothetical protein